MGKTSATVLADRGIVRVADEEAAHFLQGLVTADVEALAEGAASLAALLTPQGKILFDFLLVRAADGFLLDCRAEMAADLARRLTFYKLRAKVDVADLSEAQAVVAYWGHRPDRHPALCYADPRLPELGWRAIVARDEVEDALAGAEAADEAAWHAHRIALGVPEGGLDYAYGDAFPHDADMDRLGGVSFTKGCFIGQEVVSRMEHRGTARTRIIPVEVRGEAVPGAEIRAGGKALGTLGTTAGENAVAMVRIDRWAAALQGGEKIEADRATLVPRKLLWAEFDMPTATGAPGDGDSQ